VRQATNSTPSSRNPEDVHRVWAMCWTEMAPWHYTAADRGWRIDEALSMAEEQCMAISGIDNKSKELCREGLVYWKLQ
jgi:hypothetical protein